MCDLGDSKMCTVCTDSPVPRGIIYYGSTVSIAAVTDGTSNTASCGGKLRGRVKPNFQTDLLISPNQPTLLDTYQTCTALPKGSPPLTSLQGISWSLANMCCTTYNHVSTPITNSCAGFPNKGMVNMSMQVPPSSRHPGGVNMLFGDGTVKLVKNTVSLETWLALATRNGAVLKRVPGASDVFADPVRGKGNVDIHIDRERTARAGVPIATLNEAVESALGGKVATVTVQGRERHPVRVRYGRAWRGDEDAVRGLLVPSVRKEADGRPVLVPLADMADVRIVEGPATIKSENGLLRDYVRLNVRDANAADFVARVREVVAREVKLPEGTILEWTGQFENEARARATLRVIVPIVLALIFLILYWTYHDLADAALMMLAIPGAIAGGVFFRWLFGFKFSVAVWVGYIACFGMATSTGIIMLVYLREAVAKAGVIAALDAVGLRRAMLEGAVNRLRPRLLTEGTIILGLAPMLWAQGFGAEVIKPMAAPVLGGVLIADEVIDLLLPVAFYRVRLARLRRLGVTAEADVTTAMPRLEHTGDPLQRSEA